jgi:hypothetical protein
MLLVTHPSCDRLDYKEVRRVSTLGVIREIYLVIVHTVSTRGQYEVTHALPGDGRGETDIVL